MKKTPLFFTVTCLLLLCLLLAGCGSEPAAPVTGPDETDRAENTVAYPCTVTDDAGLTVTLTKKPQVIVSLAPSQTEILCALGALDRLKGRSAEDNYPEEAQSVPVVSTYYTPDVEKIIGIMPDLLVTSAFLADSVRAQLEQAGIVIYTSSDGNFEATENNIRNIGKLIGAEQQAEELVSAMEKEREDIRQRVAKAEKKPKVFIDLGDFFSCGDETFLDEVLADLGAVNIAGGTGTMFPQLSAEQIIAADPDVYLSFAYPADQLRTTAGFSVLKPFKNDTVFYFEPGTIEADILQRSGPRMAEGLALLAQKIYPELYV